jgi:ribosomal protein S6--L-glutamate ligase
MQFCFIVEERYRNERMPMAVADELNRQRHDVDVLEPVRTVTCLSELAGTDSKRYDAFVLKTVSGGPGLTILEAAGALGFVTVNDWRAIRLVRDKAVASAVARQHGLPFPSTYFVARRDLLEQVPSSLFPIVVKPSNGSCGDNVFRAQSPDDLAQLEHEAWADEGVLVQRYVKNPEFDLKLYNTGSGIYAIRRSSPLHPNVKVDARLVPLPDELRRLMIKIGQVFNLDVFGVDVVAGPQGWVVVDVNDFPSFGLVPDAAKSIAQTIVRRAELASRASNRQLALFNRRGHHRQRRTLRSYARCNALSSLAASA